MYVTRPSEQGAQFAPKLPDSWGRKEQGAQFPSLCFLEKGRLQDVLSGHLSGTKIPKELMFTPVEQMSKAKSCLCLQETPRGSLRGSILSDRGREGREANSCVSRGEPC